MYIYKAIDAAILGEKNGSFQLKSKRTFDPTKEPEPLQIQDQILLL